MKTFITKEAILGRTHYGLNIYTEVLRHYYPGETVLSLKGRDCQPTRNPFNNNKETLHIQIENNKAVHKDVEGKMESGDVFDFAEKHYKLSGESLLMFLNENMGLNIQKKVPPIIQEHYLPETPSPFTLPLSFPSFSYFEAPITNTVPGDTANILEIYQLLRWDILKSPTDQLRSISDKTAARRFKASNFSYVTFSGTFSKRQESGLIRHSGLLTIDFDHLPDVAAMKSKLLQDDYFDTELLFVSPSGDGLKWVISFDQTQHKHQDFFKAVSSYVRQTYGVDVDQSGKDVSRACFLGYDPEAFINPKYLINGKEKI